MLKAQEGSNAASAIVPSRECGLTIGPALCYVDRMTTKGPRVRHYLREWRIVRKLTMEQLGAMIGKDASVISRFETMDRGLSMEMQHKVTKALGITHDQLMQPPGAETLDGMAAQLDAERRAVLEEFVKAYCARYGAKAVPE